MVCGRRSRRPRRDWLAFTSKHAAKNALGLKAVDYGVQEQRFGGAAVFVLPSPSGAASGHWDVSRWQELADLVAAADSTEPAETSRGETFLQSRGGEVGHWAAMALFASPPDHYDRFMGRYSAPLAAELAEAARDRRATIAGARRRLRSRRR